MKQIWSGIQIAFAAFGGFLGWFLGGFDGFLYALIAFTVIDYITGVMCAITDKNLSSAVGFKGICRKVLIFTLVGIGNIVDVYVLGQGGVLRTAIIFFYLSNEGVSITQLLELRQWYKAWLNVTETMVVPEKPAWLE